MDTVCAWYEASVSFVYNQSSNSLFQATSLVRLRQVLQVLRLGNTLVVYEWQGSRQGNLTCTADLGPVPVPPYLLATLEARPFEKKGKVARSPPAALTPPPSERVVTENHGFRGVAAEATSYPGRGMSSDDRMLVALLSRMGEVLTAQGTVQQVMAGHKGKFQASMAEVLKSHDNQLAAQVATQQSLVTQMGSFNKSLERY